jgi:hypothetical protein
VPRGATVIGNPARVKNGDYPHRPVG